LFEKIKSFMRKINNKCTAFMFARYPEYVSVQFLENPVAPRKITRPPGLNMGYNPKKRGPTVLHQFQARGNNWTYNPYFISFLREVISMDAFPASFLNGKKAILVEYDELVKELHKLGDHDYTNALKKGQDTLIKNGIMAITTKDGIKYAYINEWDMFIAAIDAYAMFDI